MTLVELMVTVSVLAFLMLAGMPSLSKWSRNTQIRTTAESLQSGLAKARNEALRRNKRTLFSLVDSITASSCQLSATSANWIVSLQSPAGGCNVANSETAAPLILERWGSGETSTSVTVQVKDANCTTNTTRNQVAYNGYGRLDTSTSQPAAPNPLQCIVIDHSGGSGNRKLHLKISPAGQARMCDPAITDSNDPRKC
jgi:type IV fimbrial biogenesis protein FimT